MAGGKGTGRSKKYEAELALEWKKEEVEHQKASKNSEMVEVFCVANNSYSWIGCIVIGWSNNDSNDNKLIDFKKDLFQKLDAREKEAEEKITEKLVEKFDVLLRFLGAG